MAAVDPFRHDLVPDAKTIMPAKNATRREQIIQQWNSIPS